MDTMFNSCQSKDVELFFSGVTIAIHQHALALEVIKLFVLMVQ